MTPDNGNLSVQARLGQADHGEGAVRGALLLPVERGPLWIGVNEKHGPGAGQRGGHVDRERGLADAAFLVEPREDNHHGASYDEVLKYSNV